MQRLAGIEAPTPALANILSPPSGYVAWSDQPALKSSRALSHLMITLYWAASLSTGLLALAFYSRLSAWRSMWSTVDDRTLADTLVLIAAMLQVVFMLAAVAPDHPTNTKPPNSAFANLGKLEDRGADTNPLWMHPRDAAARGVCVGDIARVHNEPGSLDAPVEFDTNLRLGVVAMTHGFGHAATPGMPVVQAHLE